MRKLCLIRLIQRTGRPTGPASPSKTLIPIIILLREHTNRESENNKDRERQSD